MDNELKAKFLKNLPKIVHWIKSKFSSKVPLNCELNQKQSFFKSYLEMCIEIKSKFIKKFPKNGQWIKSNVSK